MANSRQAIKRIRQNVVRGRRRAAQRSQVRTVIKRVLAAVADDNVEAGRASFKDAEALIDRMASKGILHKNKAARHKSRLNARVKKLADAAASAAAS